MKWIQSRIIKSLIKLKLSEWNIGVLFYLYHKNSTQLNIFFDIIHQIKIVIKFYKTLKQTFSSGHH